jgi:hypothetical protein
MTFARLNRGDLLAMVAALALLLVMATDWYTTKVGEQARDIQHRISPRLDRETVPTESAKQSDLAASQEKNAWQASGVIDRVILLALLAAATLALVAAFARAADRRMGPPSPSALAALVGLVASALLVYRILQPPGLNTAAVVKIGAPLGLLCVGLLTVGARVANVMERGARADALIADADTPPRGFPRVERPADTPPRGFPQAERPSPVPVLNAPPPTGPAVAHLPPPPASARAEDLPPPAPAG